MSRRERREVVGFALAAEHGGVAPNENSPAAMNLERLLSPLGKATWAPSHPRKPAKPKDEAFRLPDPARSPIPAAYLLSSKSVERKRKGEMIGLIVFALAVLIQGTFIVTGEVPKSAKVLFIIELVSLVGLILRSAQMK